MLMFITKPPLRALLGAVNLLEEASLLLENGEKKLGILFEASLWLVYQRKKSL